MSIKVMVMDDSPFSRMMISEALSENGYEVVGEVDTLEDLIETYTTCKPDIVTMDIAMPGADGFECSRELRIHDPKAKIILVSSMKDEETEAEAKRIGVSGYVQKPVDAETLVKVITNIMSPDSLYEQLIERGLETFKEALAQNVTRMAKTPITFTAIENNDAPYISQGITTVIGIIGQSSGSMIMDLSVESAEKIAEAILKRPSKSREEVLAMVSELANIIAGIACSMLNKKDKAFGLRVSPPSLFHGNTAEIVSPSVKIQKAIAETDFGSIFLGVGFKKGSVLWM
ncbi:response regulator [Pelosinus sp. sgz500959]|uniref:response regulator n=1 Tax=Pelosinus sp. sgz500959 TaxID=3242472 RepID=UPI003671D7B4